MADFEHISFAGSRKLILQTVLDVRDGRLTPGQGTAMSQLFKEMNSNINAECQVNKLSLLTEGRAHEFGRVAGLGKRLLTAEE